MSGLKPTNTNRQEVEAHLSAEQGADLAQLEAMAGEGAGQALEVQAVEVPDLAGEISGLLTAMVGVFGPVFPSLKDIYNPETTQAAGAAVAAVCQKHGWLQNGMMGQHGEEIACVMVVGPLAFATYKGVQSDLAKRQAQSGKPAEVGFTAPVQADQMPGAKTVSVGVPA